VSPRWLARAAAVLLVTAPAVAPFSEGTSAAGENAGATPTPAATGTPEPRLQLDVDRHVAEMLDKERPRFQLEVVGRTPQEILQKHLEGFDLLCGAVDHGAPTAADMAGQRPQPGLAVSLEQIAAMLLLEGIKRIKGDAPDRYFVYRVTAAGGGHFLVREGALPESQRFVPGGVIEQVAAFPDRKTATRAWWRLEHGYKTPVADRKRNPCAPR
jgi:hypothetical protein